MFRLASAVLAATAIITIAAYSPNASAQRPDRCEPWPSCRKDADDGGGDDGGGGGGAVPAVEIQDVDAIANAITLRWDTPVPGPNESEVAHYEVWYWEAESLNGVDPDEITNLATLAERSRETPAYAPGVREYFTIRNLEVDKTYDIAVRAVSADGGVSEWTFDYATTQRTAPGDWNVETVAEVGNETTCCNTTSAQFDAAGNPTVAWMDQATMKRPGKIWFASLGAEPDSWSAETVFVAGDCQACWIREIHGFSHQPQPSDAPDSYEPGTPSILFSHRVQLRGRHTAEAVMFAHRRGADDWVAEEVVRGRARESGGINGFRARFSMDYFYDYDADSWIPTAAYVTTPQWESPGTTYALVLAERSADLSQPDNWANKKTLFECTNLNSNFTEIHSVRLRPDREGLLHAMVRMRNDYHQWALFAHRDSQGSWTYRRSDGFIPFAFDVDSEGRYYVAGQRTLASGDSLGADLILVNDSAFSDTIDPCDAPTLLVTDFETAHQAGVPDHYANGGFEGNLIGELEWSGTHGLHVTEDANGLVPPAVHIFQSLNAGNHEVSELRVLSRCSGPNFDGWVRDAVDRVHSNDARTIAVSDSMMAWAYNYGRSYARNSFPAEMVVDDRMFVAHRDMNACAAAP